MKLLNFLLGLVFLVSFSPANAQQMLPDVQLKTLEGKSINIQNYGNNEKITVLAFFATWCKPCKLELDAIHDVYADWVADYDVELVAVTIDTRRALAKVSGLVASKGWEFEVLSDVNSDIPKALGFQTIPQTFLINKKGEIVYSHNGYSPGDEYELEDEIKKLVE